MLSVSYTIIIINNKHIFSINGIVIITIIWRIQILSVIAYYKWIFKSIIIIELTNDFFGLNVVENSTLKIVLVKLKKL